MAAAPLNPRPQPWKPPVGPLQAYTREDLALVYLRQAKTAVVTMAVITVIGLVAAVIIGIVVAVSVAHENSLLNGGGGTSNCVSQGGTNPNC